MAETVSPAAGRRYGVARVCRVWGVPRSSFYAARSAATRAPTAAPARRGPKPAISDADLLAAIRADLARSPWSGEGHRKVWARLRVLDGIRVARKRVLRLMREHALLSPHRTQRRPAEAHDRSIVTDAPNLMWATDATQVATFRDGKVWLFAVAEHWNAEALGWHVSKRGTRHEALQAVSMAVRQQFGHLGRDAARGLELRHDHGSAFMAEDFHKPDQGLGHAAELRLRRTAADQRRHRALLPNLQGAGRAWPHLPEHRRLSRRRPRLRPPLQHPMAGREERPPQPSRRTSEMARPEPAVRGIVQPTVQGTGCGTGIKGRFGSLARHS